MFGTHINTLYGGLDGTQSMRRLHLAMCLLPSSQGHWVLQMPPSSFCITAHGAKRSAKLVIRLRGTLHSCSAQRACAEGTGTSTGRCGEVPTGSPEDSSAQKQMMF